jgi:hypothetical protein
VSHKITGARGATREELAEARQVQLLLLDELSRVRGAALSWRNGAAATVAGLVGFGLIKGRSEIGELERPYAIVAGLLLLLSIVAGSLSAYFFLRAAHGRVGFVAVTHSRESWEHAEAMASIRALRMGIFALMLGSALLIVAVAVTWYGPPMDGPYIRVATPHGFSCARRLERSGSQILTLVTDAGRTEISAGEVQGASVVSNCNQ